MSVGGRSEPGADAGRYARPTFDAWIFKTGNSTTLPVCGVVPACIVRGRGALHEAGAGEWWGSMNYANVLRLTRRVGQVAAVNPT